MSIFIWWLSSQELLIEDENIDSDESLKIILSQSYLVRMHLLLTNFIGQLHQWWITTHTSQGRNIEFWTDIYTAYES